MVERVETVTKPTDDDKKEKRVTKNFVFNLIYQLLVVLTPLITAPYIARVLGANNVGQFAFAFTIACYFVIFGYLGFQQYAQRAIAEVQDDKDEQSRRFWQIVIVRLVPVAISFAILLILYFVGAFGEYSPLVILFSIIVLATAFDISFYFHGRENFFIVMIINLVIRLIFLICIFTLIKKPSDLGLYTLLYSLMIMGGYLSMWAMLPRNIKRVKLGGLNFKKHMVASLSLFLPVAAVSIYALLDKTLIGVLVHGQQYYREGYITIIVQKADVQNGYYYQAERIIKALLSILLAFGTVMTTRNSIEFKNNHYGAVKKNVYRALRFAFAVGVPIALGSIVVAQSFVPVFYGPNYDGVAELIMIYAPVIIISGCSNVLGAQFLLPTKRDAKYSISVGIGFVLNLGLSCALIPFMGAKGAVVGTLIAEFAIVFVQYLFVRDDIELKLVFMNVWKYVVAGLAMFTMCYLFYVFVLANNGVDNVLNLIILIPAGAAIYYLILLLMRDHYIFRYSKLYMIKTGHFFRYATNKVVVQSTALMSTIASLTHLSHVGPHEIEDAIDDGVEEDEED